MGELKVAIHPATFWGLFKKVRLGHVLKRTDVIGKAAVSRANSVYEGNIYLHQSLPEIKVENVSEIWDLSGEPLNTYKVYLHSFQFASYLNNGFEETKDEKFLIKFEEILNSWTKYEKETTEHFLWYDFSVANRVIVLTHFLSICNNYNFELSNKTTAKLLESLISHGEFLYLDQNYVNNNHGIMMDRALLQLSQFFKSTDYYIKWSQKAIDRLESQIETSFTSDYINVENSPEYHYHTYNLFKELADFIDKNNVETNMDLNGYLNNVRQRHLELLKPDLTYPLLGDTNKQTFDSEKYIPKSVVYKNSGLAVLKTAENYLTLKSGSLNKSHKHFDDLSITFSYKGQDLLIDGGKYNYNNKDPFRKYIISPFAHNQIVINGESYSLKNMSLEKANISYFVLNEKFDIVELNNNLYEGTEIKRICLYLKPNIIFLIDTVKSTNIMESISQVYNIDSNLTVNSLSNSKLNGSTNDLNFNIYQLFSVDKCVYNFGNEIGVIRGYNSVKFGELKPCHNVEYIINNKKEVSFMSLIETHSNEKDKSELTKFNVININNDSVIFSLVENENLDVVYKFNFKEKHLYEIARINDINYSVVTRKEKNVINLSMDITGDELEFACYLLVNGKIIKKYPYQDNPEFELEFTENKNISYWYFIRSKLDREIKFIKKSSI